MHSNQTDSKGADVVGSEWPSVAGWRGRAEAAVAELKSIGGPLGLIGGLFGALFGALVGLPMMLLIFAFEEVEEFVSMRLVAVVAVGFGIWIYRDRDAAYIELARAAAYPIGARAGDRWFVVPLRNAPTGLKAVCVRYDVNEQGGSTMCYRVIRATKELVMDPLLAVEIDPRYRSAD